MPSVSPRALGLNMTNLRMPRVNVPCRQNDLGLWVSVDQFFGKGHSGPVANCLAVTQELVPLLTAKFTLVVVFGGEGILPHEAIWRVFNTGRHHVVRVCEAQLLERCAKCCKQLVRAIVNSAAAERASYMLYRYDQDLGQALSWVPFDGIGGDQCRCPP